MEDQKKFFRLLARSVDIFDIRLLAYALMPNHFHLLVCTTKGLVKRRLDLLINDSTSLPRYLNHKYQKAFVHYETVLSYFGHDDRKSRHQYRKFMAEGMGKAIASPLEKGKSTRIMGREDFIKEVKKLFITDGKNRRSLREQPELRELDQRMTPDMLIE